MSKAVHDEIEAYKREMLRSRLVRCTEPQQALFKRLYPKGVPETSLVSAIDLCDRTLKKNG